MVEATRVEREIVPVRSPEDAVEAFMQHRKVFGGRGGAGCSEQTLATYRHLLLTGGSSWAKQCGSFDKGKLEDYLTREKNRFSVSEIYFVKIVRHLKAFTKWASEAYGFSDPLAKMRVRAKEVLIKAPDRPQVEQMLAACGDDFYGRRLRLLISLYAGSGLRRNEVLGARVGDVDVAARTIKVTRKGGNQAEVPISLRAIAAFRDYMTKRPGSYPEDWLIADRDGERVRPDYVTKMVRRVAEQVGLKKAFAPHSLRHFAARESMRKTRDLNYVKELLGHSTLNMSLRYARMAGVEVRATHRRFDPLG